MKGKWHARRHEDMIGAGISDVSYYLEGNSWIELKEVKVLPVRARTGIGLGQWHVNGGAQRHFLVKRKGYLIIRVNRPHRMYLLFKYHSLPPWEKPYWNWQEMQDMAYYIWRLSINFDTLEDLIRNPE